MSLDGFIAGSKGEYDWIIDDPTMDMGALFSRFDTLLMGRRTFDLARSQESLLESMRMRVVVVSSTLDPAQYKDVTIVSSGVAQAVSALKAEPGKDIWLFGGGVLFRGMLDAGLVDEVQVAVIPVLLGSGVPLIPEGRRCSLHLDESKIYPSGIVLLSYSVSSKIDTPA
jgi:dihydrofolate reductase